MKKVKVTSGAPQVAVPGLGVLETGTWVEISKAQEATYERVTGKSLLESRAKNFEVKQETKKTTKKEVD